MTDRLRFESVLAEISSRFVNLASSDVDLAIVDSQRRVCECLGLDLSSLWQWDAEQPMRLTMTHVYRAGDGPPIPEKMSADEFFPWCQEQMVAGRVLVGESLDDLPPEAAQDREMCEALEIKAFLTFPLVVGGEAPIGAITFNTTAEERTWPEEVAQRLGLVAQVIANALDRARSDELFRESEERFSLAAESAGVGMWMLDVGTGLFWANERGRGIFGYPPGAEITLEVFLDSVHSNDRNAVAETIRRSVDAREDIDIQYRIRHPNGDVRWIQSRGRREETATGIRVQGASVDITDRKLSEERVADQLRFETLLADLSARFVKAPDAEVEHEIERAIGEVAGFFGCDRCGLLRVNEVAPRLTVGYAWFGDGITQVSKDTDIAEWYPWMFGQLAYEGRAVAVSSRNDLPPEADHDRMMMKEVGAKSILVVPLVSADGVRWALNASTLRHERQWDPGLTPRLQLLGEVFLNALERKRADEALQRSYTEVENLRHQLELENIYLKREHRLQHGSGRIVGESPAIMKVLEMAEQVAPESSTVLIEGDTGTGKELIAQRIHELSPRRDRPMVKVNCAALPSTLVESELFGREKGAYTGAVSREAGRFEVANGSTLFLDEISELPLELQAKLLRVLEEGQYERVGSSKTLHTDVRVIAATNRDLQSEVEAGRFRRDLYFRLAVFPIRVPPLTERPGDIPLLVWSAVEEFSTAMHKSVETIRREDMERLRRYDWPGNVRELRNMVERAMIMCSGSVLRVEMPGGAASGNGPVLSLDEAQRRQIAKAVEAADGRISGVGGAAEMLGLKPTTLRSKMDRLGMNPRKARGAET